MSEENKSIFERIGKAVVVVLAGLGLLVVIAWVISGGHIKPVAPQPDLPVSVITRNALLGPGRVMRLVNHSAAATLDVIVTLKNPTTQEERKYNVTISPGRWQEIGYGAGWIIHTGDQATLYSAGYRKMTYTLQ